MRGWLGPGGRREEGTLKAVFSHRALALAPSNSACSPATRLHSETKQLPLPFFLSEWLRCVSPVPGASPALSPGLRTPLLAREFASLLCFVWEIPQARRQEMCMPDTVTQLGSRRRVTETACIPLPSPGPSSPDTVLRPRRSPQLLDERELTAQLRQVGEAGPAGPGAGGR